MVLGRRGFSWRDDVRGALTVIGLGAATLGGLVLVMGAVLLLFGPGPEALP